MEAKHYFWISTAAAVVTICLKTLAWWMTGSMGLKQPKSSRPNFNRNLRKLCKTLDGQ